VSNRILLSRIHVTIPAIYAGFNNARTWLADVRQYADPNLTCILVGNKADLCESEDGVDTSTTSSAAHRKRREVPREAAELWAKEEDLLFLEASAKSGDNVDEAFQQAACDVVSKIQRGVFDDGKVRTWLTSTREQELRAQLPQSHGVKAARQPNNSLTLEQAKTRSACCG
jgi:Ras-related protein Rab-2A